MAGPREPLARLKGEKHGWEGHKAVLVAKMEHILWRKTEALRAFVLADPTLNPV